MHHEALGIGDCAGMSKTCCGGLNLSFLGIRGWVALEELNCWADRTGQNAREFNRIMFGCSYVVKCKVQVIPELTAELEHGRGNPYNSPFQIATWAGINFIGQSKHSYTTYTIARTCKIGSKYSYYIYYS